jgi:TfoX/Sxy family transcriptional regulator of competence genes
VDDSPADELLARLAPIGEVRAKRMFGAFGLYCDEHFFGLIDAGIVYFQVDEASVEAYRAAGAARFQPFPGRGKDSLGYFEVPLEVLERDAELREWAARAVTAARGKTAAPKRARGPGTKAAKKAARKSTPSPAVGKLPNLGPKSAAWLRAAGIATRADLARLGSVDAYRRVLATGVPPSLNLLYALEGALLDLRWDRLSPAVKENLRARLKALDS